MFTTVPDHLISDLFQMCALDLPTCITSGQPQQISQLYAESAFSTSRAHALHSPRNGEIFPRVVVLHPRECVEHKSWSETLHVRGDRG